MAQQLANLQTDVRVSYGNDALMPDQELGDGQTELLPQEDIVGGVGFIHPESFNQLNTENQGTSPRQQPRSLMRQKQVFLHYSFSLSLVEPVDSRPTFERGVPTRPGRHQCYTISSAFFIVTSFSTLAFDSRTSVFGGVFFFINNIAKD